MENVHKNGQQAYEVKKESIMHLNFSYDFSYKYQCFMSSFV